MDELDLFTTARPAVEPLHDDALAAIRGRLFPAADASADAVHHTFPGTGAAVAVDRLDPVMTPAARGAVRWTGARRWMLAAAAVGLVVAGVVVAQRSGSPAHTSTASDPSAPAGPAESTAGVVDDTVVTGAGDTSVPAATGGQSAVPAIGTDAVNILVVGVDNDACIDPSSPSAGGFGDRTAMGERSDTIMVLRLDPAAHRAAILSFPRDLWVDIAGGGGKQRINSAFVRDDPQRLIDTIWQNFAIAVDHYVQVDFCAFTSIVDAVGGVAVPFEYPTRDRNTGLFVAEPGCVTLAGDAALAYVRSRHYQWYADEQWHTDPLADLGRLSRQQDFVRRLLAAMGERDLFDLDTLGTLIEVVQDDVVVDSGLTISMMLGLAGALADLDPTSIAGYQIDAIGRTIAGQAVLEPVLDSQHMQAILAVFRGEAALSGGAAADDEGVVTAVESDNDTGPAPTDPSVAPAPNVLGVVPPADVAC